MHISFFRQTVTRKRPGQTAQRGSTVPDWSDAETLEISGCSVQPGTTALSQDGRVLGVTDGLTAYLPLEADVIAGDHILYGGREYTIMGEPRKWQSPTGAVSHMQLDLQRWSG